MLLNLDFLDCIKERVICSIEGQDVEYENGSAARKHYMSISGKFAPQEISVKNGVIYVSVKNMTAEIEARNRKWMEDMKEKTGEEPSFF